MSRDDRNEQGTHGQPGVEILVLNVMISRSSNRGCFPRKSWTAEDASLPLDVTLPAADELNREGNGLAVIGGLTPEVVGVRDFPLDLRGFRRLAVVDIGISIGLTIRIA